ncbi:MAG: FeoB-associated Cys-rich membrane protein [Porcipelethomonas sp.]
MITFLKENIADIVVILIIGLSVTACVIKLVRDKKKGRFSCGSCCGCPMKSECGNEKDK